MLGVRTEYLKFLMALCGPVGKSGGLERVVGDNYWCCNGFRSVFLQGGEGGLWVGLVCAVQSLKCCRQAQVPLNLVGLSFA